MKQSRTMKIYHADCSSITIKIFITNNSLVFLHNLHSITTLRWFVLIQTTAERGHYFEQHLCARDDIFYSNKPKNQATCHHTRKLSE